MGRRQEDSGPTFAEAACAACFALAMFAVAMLVRYAP